MNEPTKWYRGKQFFIKIEYASSYILLFLIMLILALGLFEIILVFGLIVFLYLLGLFTVQQYVIRKHLEEHGGETILDTYTDTDFDQGEDFLYPIEKIDEYPDISTSARNAVERFMKQMQNYFLMSGVATEQALGQLDKAITEAEKGMIVEKIEGDKGTQAPINIDVSKQLPDKKGGK